jgi:hypothetical protein
MRRAGRRLASAFLAGVLCAFVLPSFSFSSPASTRDIRVVGVKVVVPEEYKMSMAWKLEMNKMLRDIGRGFKDLFGLAFRMMETGFWRPDSYQKSLFNHLKALIKRVPRGDCHLVIGILPPWISQGPPFGAADYLHSYLLIKDQSSIKSLSNILEHELCHIFGAIDLEEKGSIMSFENRGARYDPFTSRVITLNRNRSFEDGEFPLPQDVKDEAIALYKERLGQEGKDLGAWVSERRELRVVLSHLYREKSKQVMLWNRLLH